MAKEMVGKIGALAPNHLDNGANLKKINSPVILIHGETDDVIPSKHSEVFLC
jgi:predicted esterase